MESFLDEDDYKIILKRRFKDTSVNFISANVTPISNTIEGFMGSYFILTLKYTANNKTSDEKFFLKTIPQRGSTITGIAVERNVYAKEIFFYDFLLREFDSLGLDITFAPKCFYCKSEKALIMENLPDKGYKIVEGFQCFDLELCKTGLEALAKFNGCSLVYEVKTGVTLGEKYPDILKENYFPIDQSSFGYTNYQLTINSITLLSNKLGFSDGKIHKLLENIKKIDIIKLLNAKKFKKCLGHGDFWFNNIFFKYQNCKPISCCIIDYQTLRYAPPAFDVLLFIYLNTTREFRASNLVWLLQYYYNSLSCFARDNQCDMILVFSEEEFKESVKYVHSAVLFTVFMINSFVLMPKEILSDLCAEADLYDDWTVRAKIAFVKAIEIDEKFQNVLTENLQDISECLIDDKKCLF